jgi:hypothetical protein
MSEEMARALGAGDGTVFTIGGRQCVVRPLSIKELSEVERDCVTRFKRDYLETIRDSIDLFPKEERASYLDRKLDQVAKWDADDLPTKKSYDTSRVKMTDALKAKIADLLGIKESTDERYQRLAAVALDQGMLGEEEYFQLTGEKAPWRKVDYTNWWTSSCYDGMVAFVWTCFRHYGVTREQVTEATRGNLSLLSEMVNAVSTLSRSNLGNGSGSPPRDGAATSKTPDPSASSPA